MSITLWNSFLDSIGGLLVACVLIFLVVAIGGYIIQAHRRRITHPTDYFRAYGPLWWPPLIALLPAAILAWQYYADYKRLFPATALSPIGGAVSVAAYGWVLTWALGRVLTMFPVVTPKKFRYRPIPWVRSGARSTEGDR